MDTVASPPPKAVPPGLTLHTAPPAVTRFNRRILMALLGLSSCAVFAALFYGLGIHHVQKRTAQELFTANSPVAERLNTAPSTYSDIPKPKPDNTSASTPEPGPGQRNLRNLDNAPRSPGETSLDRETEQARTSKVFFATGSQIRHAVDAPATATGATDPTAAYDSPTPSLSPLDAEAVQNQQDRKLAFLHEKSDASITSPQRVRPPTSPYLVSAGSIIRAVLITAVNSDLPGLAEAQVTEKVCDSINGNTLLIPQGARLIGEVDSQISYGQERLLAAWTQLKFLDGSTLPLDRLPGSDTAGAAGFDAMTNYHTWRLAKGAFLSSLLGISTQLATNSGTQDNNRVIVATRDSATDSINQVGQRITAEELAIQPTLTRDAGYPFAVLVAKDLVLRPLGRC